MLSDLCRPLVTGARLLLPCPICPPAHCKFLGSHPTPHPHPRPAASGWGWGTLPFYFQAEEASGVRPTGR